MSKSRPNNHLIILINLLKTYSFHLRKPSPIPQSTQSNQSHRTKSNKFAPPNLRIL